MPSLFIYEDSEIVANGIGAGVGVGVRVGVGVGVGVRVGVGAGVREGVEILVTTTVGCCTVGIGVGSVPNAETNACVATWVG